MPLFLRQLLVKLSDNEALDLWGWLDDHPSALEEMIELLVASHPRVDPSIRDKVLKRELDTRIKRIYRMLNS